MMITNLKNVTFGFEMRVSLRGQLCDRKIWKVLLPLGVARHVSERSLETLRFKGGDEPIGGVLERNPSHKERLG